MTTAYISKIIHNHNLITIEEHEDLMQQTIDSGAAAEEPEPETSQIIYTKIGCSRCGFELIDAKETKTTNDGKKYRRCFCFRCGNRAWRRTP
jgi:hypothetical protein